MFRDRKRARDILDATENPFSVLGRAEAARDEQEQGDYRAEPQEIERHQHRHDETAATEVHQDRDPEDGRYHHEQRGYRGENIAFLFHPTSSRFYQDHSCL